MGELNGRIDITLQKAVRQLEKELKMPTDAGEITGKEIAAKNEAVITRKSKPTELDINLEKTIREEMQ